MARKMKTMDGNRAAARSHMHLLKLLLCTRSPFSVMPEHTDEWKLLKAERNIFGRTVQITEMQSKAGAGAVHGSLVAGALIATYTASQGLLLMIPDLSKTGERLPGALSMYLHVQYLLTL